MDDLLGGLGGVRGGGEVCDDVLDYGAGVVAVGGDGILGELVELFGVKDVEAFLSKLIRCVLLGAEVIAKNLLGCCRASCRQRGKGRGTSYGRPISRKSCAGQP